MKLTEAQIERVKMLEDDRGVVTPNAVVSDARKKSSPLHALFDWNDKTAAERQRVAVARDVIGSVKVVITMRETTIKAPHYVHDPSSPKQGYRAVASLRRDEEDAREALRGELTRVAGNLKRAREIAVSLGLEEEVDLMLNQIVGLQSALAHGDEVVVPEEARPS